MRTVRVTMAQALVRFLAQQYVERDGVRQRFFAGAFGIFGHGNVAGIGQALLEREAELTYYQARNEQAMVHIACGYARMKDRLATFACTSSIGPGATNMLTGAALATINRLPVLLLPGDVFVSRRPDPVLQQLEVPSRGDVSVNDAFQVVSRYWDRITRAEQIVPAALSAMRVLTSPADTGAVTLALPQDVQTEAFDCPADFLRERVWTIERRRPDREALDAAIRVLRDAKRPLVVAGGGVIYSGATDALRRFVERSGIPVAETQAGKGSLRYDNALSLGAIGATGTSAANRIARDADVVVGIGTRWTDFTTASRTAFANERVRFINVNVAEVDAVKHGGVAVVADARATLEALEGAPIATPREYRDEVARLHEEWDREVSRLYALDHAPLPAQSEVIGAVNEAAGETGVVVCAAGSMPGELHKLWRARDPKQYHVEYGYSCMGYEIPGGIGVKMAAPERDVIVLVGDGSYLMMPSEIVTAIQERVAITIVLVDNHGFSSIGALSRSLGLDGFGTQYRYREDGTIGMDSEAEPPAYLPIDLAANAESLGANALRAKTIPELRGALREAKRADRTTVIAIEVDRYAGVPSYDSWWEVATAEVAEAKPAREAREAYEVAKRRQRWHV
ncbi:MAG TPA: 3D-(3,5/4)-trihydroxycyclohexane-1,2-dione acylhydrolase (decyclizing) [Candidatus Dormibacteraeota bacterium]|nr:3D-(3,5/4)-trihydroxycyclohexane-1,2-dione acylhydrolase (decyclizing) [Candidatus Dormibacteraeota bacterium]